MSATAGADSFILGKKKPGFNPGFFMLRAYLLIAFSNIRSIFAQHSSTEDCAAVAVF